MDVICHKCGKSFEPKLLPSENHTKSLNRGTGGIGTGATRMVTCPICGTLNIIQV
jgi:DNA-directed RNA polymerase subunit RPC12/RpoP